MKLVVLYNEKLIKERTMTNGTTSEAAALKIGSKYDMILIATARARDLKRGHAPLVEQTHGPLVTALQEIEEGKIGLDYLAKARKK
jgi:DNA-directed RNA polymerase subunit omega